MPAGQPIHRPAYILPTEQSLDYLRWSFNGGFVVFSLYAPPRSLVEKLNEAQRQQVEANRELANLFDNMPIAYMKAKLLHDPSGEIADLEICRTNGRFITNFARSIESDRYLGSELFDGDLSVTLQLAKLADAEKRAITYTQYFSESDSYQNIVVTPATKDGYVDAYYVNATELHKAQQKLNDTNHKLAMALDVANIVPWNWNLREHKILCDVNRPVELSDMVNQVDEENCRYRTRSISPRYIRKINSG